MPLVRTEVEEKTYEGYVRLDFKSTVGGMPLTGDVGLRVAHVTTDSSGWQTLDGGNTYSPVSVSNEYTDVLPSLNAILHLTDTQLLRFGASIAISRPPLDALTTGFSLNPTGNPPTGGGGNPKLDPYKADQIDFSYEWYFHEESLFAIAPYYKYVKTYIGASQSTETINGTQYIITSENNTKGGEIGRRRTHAADAILLSAGIPAGFRHLRESRPGGIEYPRSGAASGHPIPDGRLRQGHLGSSICSTTRAASNRAWPLKHHTPFTVAPTWVGTTLKMLEPETTLDASVSYTFRKDWSVRLQGRNLTNERARFTADNNPQNLANDGGYQVYGRSYLLDVGVTF